MERRKNERLLAETLTKKKTTVAKKKKGAQAPNPAASPTRVTSTGHKSLTR